LKALQHGGINEAMGIDRSTVSGSLVRLENAVNIPHKTDIRIGWRPRAPNELRDNRPRMTAERQGKLWLTPLKYAGNFDEGQLHMKAKPYTCVVDGWSADVACRISIFSASNTSARFSKDFSTARSRNTKIHPNVARA